MYTILLYLLSFLGSLSSSAGFSSTSFIVVSTTFPSHSVLLQQVAPLPEQVGFLHQKFVLNSSQLLTYFTPQGIPLRITILPVPNSTLPDWLQHNVTSLIWEGTPTHVDDLGIYPLLLLLNSSYGNHITAPFNISIHSLTIAPTEATQPHSTAVVLSRNNLKVLFRLLSFFTIFIACVGGIFRYALINRAEERQQREQADIAFELEQAAYQNDADNPDNN
ncbi:MAG: hypothetical protein AAF770_01565 [Bacteroidota bacterium]